MNTSIAARIAAISKELPEHVLLLAVSKYHSEESIMQAYMAGQRHFAESRQQELLRKARNLPPDIQWHFIGHLQSNKIKTIAPIACLIHSVDSENLAMALEQHSMQHNATINCLLQVRIAQETTKFGFLMEDIKNFFSQQKHLAMPHVRICGLMGMATNTAEHHIIRREFHAIRALYDDIKNTHHLPHFNQLSIGMSSDYHIAIEEGSTIIRIGSSIFGDR